MIQYHKGKLVRNFEAWYAMDGTYVEEFDTDDGHFRAEAKPQDYPEDIRKEAIELGVIDQNGNLIPCLEKPQ